MVQYWTPKPRRPSSKQKKDEEAEEDEQEEEEDEEKKEQDGGGQEEGEEEEEKAEDEEVDVLPAEGPEAMQEDEPAQDAENVVNNLCLLRKMGLDPCSPEPPSAYVAEEPKVGKPFSMDQVLATAPPEHDPAARLAYLEPTVCIGFVGLV